MLGMLTDRVVRQAQARGDFATLVSKGDTVAFLFCEGLMLMRSAMNDENKVRKT